MNNLTDTDWKGYTLEEIRFHRMLAMAKAEIGKTYLTAQIKSRTDGNLIKSPMLSKLTGALSYFDYGILAYRIFRRIARTLKRR